MKTRTYTFETDSPGPDRHASRRQSLERRLPLPTIIGMLSEEIAAMRRGGFTDEQIAALIQKASGIVLDTETLADLYAPPAKK